VRKNILFRADGNSEIGLGHIYRCIGLAQRLKSEFNVFIAIYEPSESLKNNIQLHATLLLLPKFESFLEEAKYIVNEIVPKYAIQIITLDGYHFDTSYQRALRKDNLITLISIDDDQPFHYVSDIVINHAGGIKENCFSAEKYTKFYLGEDYLLLRDEFLSYRKNSKIITDIVNVFICFGGADKENYTWKTLESLIALQDLRFSVVLGSSNKKLGDIKKLAKNNKNIQLYFNLGPIDLANLMFNSDLGILPSSTISLEALCCKMLLITGATAKNQINIYNGLIKKDIVFGIQDYTLFDINKLSVILTKIKSSKKEYFFEPIHSIEDPIINLYKSI
jgi:UDP-2,4-diacetamido-2,4,6-trideoxy-beta-L-altropyranose hydrolase